MTSDPSCVSWLQSRALDPEAVELWDLVRVLGPAPAWARLGDRSWTATGHRLIVRLFGASGEHESFRARRVTDDETFPKVLAPQGFEIRGLVMGCPVGVALLRGEPPSWWRPEIVVSEGVPDWLTWASRQSDGQEQGPAYFGIDAGSWTAEVAARVPDGAEVFVRTHGDEAGIKYADAVAATLGGRCAVYRARLEGASP